MKCLPMLQPLLFIVLLFSPMSTTVIFDFHENADLRNWIIVDDVVMGGSSAGSLRINETGHGVFEGAVSLENNGGFSSVRYNFDSTEIASYTKVVLTIRGDAKQYQFRVKTNSGDYYSYVAPFETTDTWQEVEIVLKDMYPTFRGRVLDQPNFPAQSFEEIAILIGNKKQERFQLLIDKIELR